MKAAREDIEIADSKVGVAQQDMPCAVCGVLILRGEAVHTLSGSHRLTVRKHLECEEV